MPYLPKREEGQGLVEYALILVLVAIVVIGVLLQLGPQIRQTFGRITAILQNAGVAIDAGAITYVDAAYTPGGFGTNPTVTITVNVLQDVTVSINGDGGISGGGACAAPSCSFSFTGAYPSNGQAVVQDNLGGEGYTASW